MAMYLVEQPEGLMQRLAKALLEAEQKLVCCGDVGRLQKEYKIRVRFAHNLVPIKPAFALWSHRLTSCTLNIQARIRVVIMR